MSDKKEQQKKQAAEAAISKIPYEAIVGVGTGSTVNYFIEALASIKAKIECAVSSSKATTEKLKALHIPVYELNSVSQIDVYVDGADEITKHLYCIKGGGAALTGEKILRQAAKQFICIADESKFVKMLGQYPLPVEVLPMARSLVGREILKMGGDPIYRENVVTDYSNVILDVHNLDLVDPITVESQLNQIPGVITNGLFAANPANLLLLGTDDGIKEVT